MHEDPLSTYQKNISLLDSLFNSDGISIEIVEQFSFKEQLSGRLLACLIVLSRILLQQRRFIVLRNAKKNKQRDYWSLYTQLKVFYPSLLFSLLNAFFSYEVLSLCSYCVRIKRRRGRDLEERIFRLGGLEGRINKCFCYYTTITVLFYLNNGKNKSFLLRLLSRSSLDGLMMSREIS